METPNKKTTKFNRFNQGYLCAVATLIRMNNEVDTQTKELFRSGVGEYNLRKMRQWGVDESDIEIFKKFRKEL